MGWKAKLTNRFEGPYKVISKNNDTFKLQKVNEGGRSNVISHQTSALKPYTTSPQQGPSASIAAMLSILCILMLLVEPVINLDFNWAPPIVWQRSRKYVSKGYTEIVLQVIKANPCQALRQYALPDSGPDMLIQIEQAISTCNNLFDNQITGRIANIKLLPKTQKDPIAFMHANKPPNPEVLLPKRAKRDTTSFITGAFVSNVLETIKENFFPNHYEKELRERQHFLEEKSQDMVRTINGIQLLQQASNEAVVNNAEAIAHNLENVVDISRLYPQLMVVTSHLVFKIQMDGYMLDKLRN